MSKWSCGVKKNVHKVLVGRLERNHLEAWGEDGRIALKCILQKVAVRVWTGLICLWTGRSDNAVVSMLMTHFSISKHAAHGVSVCHEAKDVIYTQWLTCAGVNSRFGKHIRGRTRCKVPKPRYWWKRQEFFKADEEYNKLFATSDTIQWSMQ
jgi:phenylpropionate dioxygenase-like ring-hydroxylating dioxygenase large terminal subunit